MMNWGWPQFVYAGVMILGLGYALAKNGQPKTDKYDFGAALIGRAVWCWILYMGGFWS